MKILALIAARGGSKRLPGKNIRPLGGKPLIVWTIDLAKKIPEICDILVSTDDQAIFGISVAAGALVPWLRPAELANDTASSVDVALHALDWYEACYGVVDGLLLLQPTSPFRSREMVCEGIKLFEENGRKAVLSISPASTHPMWALKFQGDNVVPFVEGDGLRLRSQDLPSAYQVNGGIYLISPAELRQRRAFTGAVTFPVLVESPIEALDIDTEWDFRIAEFVTADQCSLPKQTISRKKK
jgi:CMP-N,N'-diacetyllegionaminic acid synthase